MSKPINELLDQNRLPAAREFLAFEQHLNVNQLPGRWNDPEYLAQLEKEHLIRESNKLVMHTASNVVSEPKTWIYPNWLQQNEVTGIAGPPGAGKTTLACALAAGITRGKDYSLGPGLTPTGSGHVIIINREDNIATGLKPRLEAAGADLTRVHFIGCKGGIGDHSAFAFSSEQDLARLEGHAKLLGDNLGLIIIDPIYFAVEGDSNNNFKAREAYERLAWLSKRLTCAILGIAHTVRNTQNKGPLARVAGPPALREVPRAFMVLSKILNGPTATGGTHVLVHAKNNEGRLDGGFEYRLTPVGIPGPNGPIETTKFLITLQLVGLPDDILNEADRGAEVKSPRKFDAAVKFLCDVLKDGPRLWINVEERAKEAGVTKGTLMNAKTFLNIVTKKRNGDGRSIWRLPELASDDDSLN